MVTIRASSDPRLYISILFCSFQAGGIELVVWN